MPGWDTFAVIVGGGALVGLLFVAMSISATQIGSSASLRGRAAQTLVVFATLLLLAILLAIPSQSDRVIGAELVILAAGAGVRWAPYALLPTTCVAIIGGLASANLLPTKLSG
ncbi:hypothetical protein [Mycolicibacterium cosmeticum]|uniref:hypothetical protein n=1 Tax=Mycolicibacterium cosmeticum TaxID=258533 RepID=UPI003204A9A0